MFIQMVPTGSTPMAKFLSQGRLLEAATSPRARPARSPAAMLRERLGLLTGLNLLP
jgi:hypothetical protein